VSQGITVAAGDYVAASVDAYIRSADSIAGTGNSAQMKIEFYNTYGAAYESSAFLGEVLTTIVDGTSPNNVWLNEELGGIAPAGTVEARLVLQFLQSSNQSGTVHLDSVLFGVEEFAFAPADFNRDGLVNGDDLLVWGESYGIDGGADADGDGDTDGRDFLQWQRGFAAGDPLTSTNIAVPEMNSLAFVWVAKVVICFFMDSVRCNFTRISRRSPSVPRQN
jgi:hypothetical protein